MLQLKIFKIKDCKGTRIPMQFSLPSKNVDKVFLLFLVSITAVAQLNRILAVIHLEFFALSVVPVYRLIMMIEDCDTLVFLMQLKLSQWEFEPLYFNFSLATSLIKSR